MARLYSFMLQKQHNYKLSKTCTGTRAGTGAGTDNRQYTKRFKADKNVVRSCYTRIQTNKDFYIIFIIAIYLIDTKNASKGL